MARERAADRRETATAAAERAPGPGLSIAEIRQLITMLHNSDVEELAIEHEAEGLKLVLRKPTPAMAPMLAPMGVAEPDGEPLDGALPPDDTSREKVFEIVSPLVGVFRAAMKPGSKPLVHAGDVVREGQVVGAVEALNVLNEIENSAPGRVREVCARDGQPVEYGQPLFLIELK